MIHFEKDRWAYIKEAYEAWWNHKCERPILNITVPNAHAPEAKLTQAPILSQANCTDFSWSPKELIEALDWRLSQNEYLYEGYPYINMDSFGPGVVAAFCKEGAELDNSSGQVWFAPKEYLPISEIHAEYDPNNRWVKRIKEIYEAGMDKWKGNVLMGTPDLGGCLDIAASLRGSENLLFDLYDEPEEVVRLCEEINQVWDQAYADFDKILRPDSPGYSDWTGIFSSVPSYVLQCDFSYMISNDMFREFALSSLEKYSKQLPHAIYHMDGVGELNHFDDLLGIKELDAIQWVPGDGKPSPKNWPEVYQKIAASGKSMHVVGGLDDLEAVMKLGNNNLYYLAHLSFEDAKRLEKILG